jgi:hypothetical protein
VAVFRPMASRWPREIPAGNVTIYPVSGGNPVEVSSTQPREEPVQWTLIETLCQWVGARSQLAFSQLTWLQKNETIEVFHASRPYRVVWKCAPDFSRDLKSYVYTYERITSDLYVVDGLR